MGNSVEQPAQLSDQQLKEQLAQKEAGLVASQRNFQRVNALVSIFSTLGFLGTSLVPKLQKYAPYAMLPSLAGAAVGLAGSEMLASKQQTVTEQTAPLREEQFRRQLDASVQRNMQGSTRMPQAA